LIVIFFSLLLRFNYNYSLLCQKKSSASASLCSGYKRACYPPALLEPDSLYTQPLRSVGGGDYLVLSSSAGYLRIYFACKGSKSLTNSKKKTTDFANFAYSEREIANSTTRSTRRQCRRAHPNGCLGGYYSLSKKSYATFISIFLQTLLVL
jgi:hypothetical protein